MKFKYHVKHDGVWYAPGEEVPVKPQKVEEKAAEEEMPETETEPKAEPASKRRGRQSRGRQ